MNQRKLSLISMAALVSLSVSIGFHGQAGAADKPAAAPQNIIPSPTEMPATTAAQAKLTAEKRDAIRRLMTVTRLPQVADKMYDMLLAQGQKSFELNMSRALQEDTRYTEEQRRDLMQKVAASSVRMFARYRELLPKEINLPDVLESVSTQVYDKYFTAKELNDISDFYQTEAGKKALDVLPQVMQESAQMTGEIVTPKVKSMVAQILQEEKTQLEAAEASATAAGPNPAAKATEAKKEEPKK